MRSNILDQPADFQPSILRLSEFNSSPVVAAWLIANRQVSTLVLVHTRQLMDQWINRLTSFLGLQASEIGQIGAGKMHATGQVDVGILQSFDYADLEVPMLRRMFSAD